MFSTIQHLYRIYKHSVRDKKTASKRSSHWHTIEKTWLKKQAQCQACGTSKNLNVHHKIPFHINPDLELDESNLITLCMKKGKHCHLLLGHGGSFRCWQENVENMAGLLRQAYDKKDKVTVSDIIKEAKATRKGPDQH